jgi:hypothetical protein
MCVSCFSTTVARNLFRSTKYLVSYARGAHRNTYRAFMQSIRYCRSILTKSRMCRQNLELPISNLMKCFSQSVVLKFSNCFMRVYRAVEESKRIFASPVRTRLKTDSEKEYNPRLQSSSCLAVRATVSDRSVCVGYSVALY